MAPSKGRNSIPMLGPVLGFIQWSSLVIPIIGFLFLSCQSSNPKDPDESSDGEHNPISGWTYRDTAYTLVSALAEQTRTFERDPTSGITVFLTNQNIDCSDSPVKIIDHMGAWIEVQFPGIEVKEYDKLEISGTMGFWGQSEEQTTSSMISGNLGPAALTFADTIEERRVSGWIDFDKTNFFQDGEVNGVYGSFDVSFCPTVVDSE